MVRIFLLAKKGDKAYRPSTWSVMAKKGHVPTQMPTIKPIKVPLFYPPSAHPNAYCQIYAFRA